MIEDIPEPHKATAALLARVREITERAEALRRYVLFLMVAGIAVILAVVIAYGFYVNPNAHPAQAMVVATGIIPSFILYRLLNGFYQRKYKIYLVAKVCEGLGFTYSEDGAFPVNETADHKALPPAEQAFVEAGFSGEYRDLRVDIQDAVLRNLVQVKNANDPRREMRDFQGVLIRLRFGRTLGAHTVMIPAAAHAAFFAQTFADYKSLRPSNEAFEKNYVALSTDTVEAKFTLTSSFVERFMEAGKLMGAKWGAASFSGNEILFVMQTFRPLFDITPLWRPVVQESLLRSVVELDAIFKMVDSLKSNSQLGI